jgi:hypothetical protein
VGIKIDDTSMHAEISGATAERNDSGKWAVSWLPERQVDRNQAVTAMVLAEELTTDRPANDSGWLFIDGWSEELGLNRNQALELFGQARKSPELEPGA